MVDMSKMSLDETVRWMYVGSEQCVKQIGETRDKTRDKTRDETHDEMSNEMCKRKMKDISKPTSGIHGKWQIVTLALSEPLHFSEEKKHFCHHRLQ
jgi:hypothetical protein